MVLIDQDRRDRDLLDLLVLGFLDLLVVLVLFDLLVVLVFDFDLFDRLLLRLFCMAPARSAFAPSASPAAPSALAPIA